MSVWFSSDFHFGHANVIKYAKRPFSTVEEMDAALVGRWNARVKPGDCGYILGDFTLNRDPLVAKSMAERMNGQKFLLLGNHDRWTEKVKDPAQVGFVWIRPYHELKVEDQKIILCHYPFLTWNGAHRGSWDLHGHCHNTLSLNMGARRMDVGVDCWNYAPVSFETVRDKMSKFSYEPVDHHGAEAGDD